MAREIGLSCWPTGHRRGCDAQFSITQQRCETDDEAEKRMEREAGQAGWCIGHWDGQGYFVCPDHKDSVWNARPLT